MSAPNLTVKGEPFESGKMVFLPLAPKSNNDKPTAQLSFKLSIINHESKPVSLSSVKATLKNTDGSVNGTATVYTAALNIAAGSSADWWNDAQKNILFSLPYPKTVEFALSCAGFSQPFTVSFSLAAHQSPVAGGSFHFPARATELRENEYWQGASAAHWSGGDQLFAYDLGMTGWDANTKQWSDLLPGKNGTKNEDYRVFGKSIYAMADGTVVDFRGDLPNNPKPGSFPDASTIVDYAGNHFYLQHGDELVVYPHLQPGSLNTAFTKKGAVVRRGDFLGLVGSSGNASAPHIHIHSIQGTAPWVGPLRPVPFTDIHVLDKAALQPDRSGPWLKVTGQGLPSTYAAIWPANTSPYWNSQLRCSGVWNPGNYGQYYRWGYALEDFKHEQKTLWDMGFRLLSQQAYDIGGGQIRYDGIWNQSSANQLVVWGWALNDLKNKMQEMHTSGFRIISLNAYDAGGGQWRYNAVWNPGNWAQYAVFGLSLNDFKAKSQEMFNNKFRLVQQQAYQVNGQWQYDAVWNPGDHGQFAVWGWSLQDFQTKMQEMHTNNYRLIHQQAYNIGGGQWRYDGIWNPGTYAQYAVLGWTGDYFHAKCTEMFEAGFRLIGQQSYHL